MTDLFQENRQALWDHVSSDLNNSLLDSELHDLWIVATDSCRKEIKRLERLIAFQERGRIMDAEARSAYIACIAPARDTAQEALEFCARICNGAGLMTRDLFAEAMKKAINADRDYSNGCFIPFQNNPAAFLAHRNPPSQAIELLRVMLDLTKPK